MKTMKTMRITVAVELEITVPDDFPGDVAHVIKMRNVGAGVERDVGAGIERHDT